MTQPTTAEIVGGNVRAEMARQRIPQASVAAWLGISQSAVSNRLSGATPFDVNELVKVSAMLGVSVNHLLEEQGASA